LGFGKVVASVFLFGFGLFSIGLLIAVFKGAFVNRVKDIYWIDNTPFLKLMDFEYNIIALVIMVMGLLCVVIAGFESHKKEVEY